MARVLPAPPLLRVALLLLSPPVSLTLRDLQFQHVETLTSFIHTAGAVATTAPVDTQAVPAPTTATGTLLFHIDQPL